MQIKNDQKGTVNIILIMTIMIIGLVVLGSMLAITMNNLTTTQTIIRSKQAHYLADSCIEYALYGIYATQTYSGNETLNFDSGSCSYTLLQLTPLTVRITSIGEVGKTSTTVISEIQIDPEVKVSTYEVN